MDEVSVIVALVIVIRIISNTAANVFQKRLTVEGINGGTVATASYLLLALISFVLLPFLHFPRTESSFWRSVAAAGVLDALAYFLLLLALQRTDLSLFGPLNAFKAIISMIFAALILKEQPTVLGVAGAVIIVIGSYLLAPRVGRKRDVRGLLRDRGVWYRFASLAIFALGAVFLKDAVTSGGVAQSFCGWVFFGLLTASIVGVFQRRWSLGAAVASLKHEPRLFAPLAGCMATQQLATHYTFGALYIGYALSFFQLGMVLQVIAGKVFFRESEFRQRLLACLVMVLGSLLIISHG